MRYKERFKKHPVYNLIQTVRGGIESRWIGDASRLAKSRTIAGLLIVEEMGE